MNTYYIIGDAQVASNNPIQQQYGTFFVGLEVNVHGHIVEASCNAILPLTRDFIRRLLVGRDIKDIEKIDQSGGDDDGQNTGGGEEALPKEEDDNGGDEGETVDQPEHAPEEPVSDSTVNRDDDFTENQGSGDKQGSDQGSDEEPGSSAASPEETE